jgi:hypothetical protein
MENDIVYPFVTILSLILLVAIANIERAFSTTNIVKNV